MARRRTSVLIVFLPALVALLVVVSAYQEGVGQAIAQQAAVQREPIVSSWIQIQRLDENEAGYERLIETQRYLIRSAWLIASVVRDPAIANLEPLMKSDNPTEWILSRLTVQRPERSDLLRIGMQGADVEVLTKILDEITDKYMEHTKAEQRHMNLQRLSVLDRQHSKLVDELRQKRAMMIELARKLETLDSVEVVNRAEIKRQDRHDIARTLRQSQLNQIRQRKRLELYGKDSTEAKQAAIELAVVGAEVEHLKNELTMIEDSLRQLGRQSAEIDQIRHEIGDLEKAVTMCRTRLEEARVQLDQPPRVRVIQPADAADPMRD
jgi:hypothetical protein